MTATARAPVPLLAAAAFCSTAAMRVCDPLLPRFAQEYQRSAGDSSGVIVGFAIAYGFMQLLFGPLGDRFGKQRMIAVALLGCALASTAAVLAQDFETLLAFRIAWGMGAAGIVPLAMAWVGDSVPYEQRQPTLARLLLGTLSGMVAGQLIGGLFAEGPWGWRGAFLTLGVGYWVMAAMLWFRPREAAPAAAHAPHHRQIAAVLGERWALVVLLAVFLEGLFLLGPLAYLPSYLHQREGLGLRAASVVAALYAGGGLVYALSARRIVPWLGERGMSSAGGMLMAACLVGLWLLPHWTSASALALLLGFGTYLFHNTLQTHATQMAPAARGTAVSLFAFALFVGQAVGVTAFGGMLDREAYAALLVAPGVGLLIAGVGFAWALRRRAAAAATVTAAG
jgi:predicted MFS family arabinose efflux permease